MGVVTKKSRIEDTDRIETLSPEILLKLEETVELALVLEIELLKYSATFVGGIDKTRSEFLLQTTNIPPLPFDTLCINRIPQFASRFEMMKSLPKFAVYTIVKQDDSVSAVMFKAGRTDLQFFCPSPNQVRVPKEAPEPPYYKVPIDETVINILSKAHTVMKCENVFVEGQVEEDEKTEVVTKRAVAFEMKDISNDPFSHVVKITDDDNKVFRSRFAYPLKIFVPILKRAVKGGATFFHMGQVKGILSVQIGDYTVHIASRTIKEI